jgi:alpha-galactosidase
VSDTLKDALTGADFVVISILPATFEEMRSDVHLPERLGILQPVGDTVGAGGFMRAMRTIPMYVEIGSAIRDYAPDAWVINYTNPMSLCVRTLYEVFPAVKAFGCCHEVFGTQKLLCAMLRDTLGVSDVRRQDLNTTVTGINHFTWITEARWQDTDVLSLLPGFIEKYYEKGYCEKPGIAPDGFRTDPFLYGNKVKMDLFLKYGVLAAAGDRHLVEFLPNSCYLSGPEAAEKWLYHLTTVDYRKEDQRKKKLFKNKQCQAHSCKTNPAAAIFCSVVHRVFSHL